MPSLAQSAAHFSMTARWWDIPIGRVATRQPANQDTMQTTITTLLFIDNIGPSATRCKVLRAVHAGTACNHPATRCLVNCRAITNHAMLECTGDPGWPASERTTRASRRLPASSEGNLDTCCRAHPGQLHRGVDGGAAHVGAAVAGRPDRRVRRQLQAVAAAVLPSGGAAPELPSPVGLGRRVCGRWVGAAARTQSVRHDRLQAAAVRVSLPTAPRIVVRTPSKRRTACLCLACCHNLAHPYFTAKWFKHGQCGARPPIFKQAQHNRAALRSLLA